MPPVTPEAKAQLAEKVVSLGVIAALKEVATISAETGLTPSQIRSQLEPSRGIRRQLTRYARNIGGGAGAGAKE